MLYQDVLQFQPGEATGLLAAIRAMPLPCAWDEHMDDGPPLRFDVRPLALATLGDESVALAITMHGDGIATEAEVVFIRRGELVTMVTHLAVAEQAATLDPALTQQLAQRAAEKLSLIAHHH